MTAAPAPRKRGWIAALFLCGALLTAIIGTALTIESTMPSARAVPTACPDTIACHALKRAVTPVTQP
mgnify:FL=1